MKLPSTGAMLKVWAAICGAMLAFAVALMFLTMALTMATDLGAEKLAIYQAVHGQCAKARRTATYSALGGWRVKELCGE